MNQLIAAIAVIPLVLALAWMPWYLAGRQERQRVERMQAHLSHFGGDGKPASITELIDTYERRLKRQEARTE